jgi:hypothetical protein
VERGGCSNISSSFGENKWHQYSPCVNRRHPIKIRDRNSWRNPEGPFWPCGRKLETASRIGLNDLWVRSQNKFWNERLFPIRGTISRLFSKNARKITENQPEKSIFRHYWKRNTPEYDSQRDTHTGHIGVCLVMHHAILFCFIKNGLYFWINWNSCDVELYQWLNVVNSKILALYSRHVGYFGSL